MFEIYLFVSVFQFAALDSVRVAGCPECQVQKASAVRQSTSSTSNATRGLDGAFGNATGSHCTFVGTFVLQFDALRRQPKMARRFPVCKTRRSTSEANKDASKKNVR